jgi:hypothetical protein
VADHPFFDERGLTPEMIETFGLGIATRGIMKGRLVFPIHNADGKLVAYCGRFVGDDRPEDEPKYKQPPHFRKEIELFNWHRVKGDVTGDTRVILVESFFRSSKCTLCIRSSRRWGAHCQSDRLSFSKRAECRR